MRKIKKAVCVMLCAVMCMGSISAYAVSPDLPEETTGTTEAETAAVEEPEKEPAAEEESSTADYGYYGGESGWERYEDAGDGTLQDEYREEEPVTGKVRFTDILTGGEIPAEALSFDRECTYEDGEYFFPETQAGDQVAYTISGEDVAEVRGTLTLGSYDVVVDEEYIIKVGMDSGQTEIKRNYTDKTFSMLDYINVPSDYTGQITYRVVSGDDAVSVSGDGTVAILAAKDAEVEVTFGSDRLYKETVMTVHISIEKGYAGTVNAEDVVWDNLEQRYSEDNEYVLTGTVNAVGDELFGVTAYVSADENRIGQTGTVVNKAVFTNAENYDISLSERGPEITVTGRRGKLAEGTDDGQDDAEASVTASYDAGTPLNGMYFNNKRTLTIAVSDENYNEDLLSVSVETDGGTLSLDEIRTGAEGIRLVTDKEEDEEAGTVTYGIEFGEEGTEKTFRVSVSYDGKEALSDEFCVDMLAPVLSVRYEKEDGSAFEPAQEPASAYSLSPVTAVITVQDGSFYSGGAEVSVSAQDADGKDITQDAYPSSYTEDIKEGSWDDSGNIHTFTMEPFSADANYSVSAEYSDLAGNVAEPCDERFFTVDGTAPEGKIYVTTADGQKKEYERILTEKEKSEGLIGFVFDVFSKTVTLESEAHDTASGIASVQYYLADVEKDAGLEFEQKAVLEDLDWQDYREGIKIDTDRIAVILEKITDKAGNISYISSGGGMVVDTKEPGVPVIMIKGAKEDVYNRNVAFDIYVTDPDNGSEGVFSGVKSVVYELTDSKGTKPEKLGGKEVNTPRQRDLSDSLLVSTAKYNKNGLVLRVTAEDYAENRAVKEQSFSIDVTDPVIDIKFDGSAAKNGHYFNETQEMEVSFTERNFDEKKTEMSFTCGGEEHTYTMKDLSDGKAAEAGITVSRKTDSEQDAQETEYTDSRKVVYTILLGEGSGTDTDYSSIKFTCEDKAGNKTEKKYEDLDVITIDKIAPVMSVSYYEGGRNITSSVSSAQNAPYYTNKPVTASVSVTDRNFGAGGMEAELEQTDYFGNSVQAYDSTGLRALQEDGRWTKNGNTSTHTMAAFSGDANYGLGFTCTDLAGNKAAGYRAHYFTIDTVAPEGTITVDSTDGTGTYDSFTRNVVFRFISRYSITLTRDASDATSGVASVRYIRYTPPVYASGVFDALSLEDLRNADWMDWSDGGILAVDPDSQAVVYARIADRAGNVTYINTEGAMIADSTDPERPEISISISEPESGIFNSDVPVSYSAADTVSGDTYAGLRRVSVQVMNGSTVTQSDSIDFGDKSARQRTASGSITVDAQANNSNDVTVIVTAEDYAGNISSSERQFAIDITAPRIEVEYDLNDPVNGKYYNQVRTAVVTVYERNFDPSGVDLDLSSSLGASASISGWTIGGQAGVSDDNPNVCTIVYEEDSDYSFTIAVTDRAGNRTDYGQTDSFTIDRTDPEITVSFDQNRDGRYYNVVRTATVTVKERNFDESAFTEAISAELEGKGITAPPLIGWSGTDEYHTATITFADDGDYSFELGDTDLAGNTALKYTSPLFTIDRTAPEVEFSGVEDGSANKNAVDPAVSYFDINLDIRGGVKVFLEGHRHARREVTGEVAGTSGIFTLGDFAQTLENDDVYTLTAVVRDLAGNETEKTITFSVNRFGSNFYFSDETAKFITDYYHRDAEDIVIYEVNVDPVTDVEITLTHNGVSKALGKDAFTAEDLSEGEGWNRYMYTVPKKLFAEEGIYEIMVDSTDKAGNRQNNKTKKAPAAFVVDRTAPGIVITGIEDGGIYNEKSREVTVAVSDDRAAGKVEVFVDGEKKAEFTEEEIRKNEGKLPYTVEETGDWTVLSAKAVDKAGNEASSQEYRILMTTSLFKRIINSGAAPIAFPVILLILIAAGTAARKFTAK